MGIEIIGAKTGSEYQAYVNAAFKPAVREEAGPLPGTTAPDGALGFKSGEENVYLDEALEKLRSISDIFNRRLDFEVDRDTNRIIVKVIDTKTDKVVKEIPPAQLVQLAAKIQEMIGILVDEER
jgi:hypothetical protein